MYPSIPNGIKSSSKKAFTLKSDFMLSNLFQELCQQFTNDNSRIEAYWQKWKPITPLKERHYHTLTHLENLVNEIGPLKQEIQNRFVVLFVVFYHDIIYIPGKNNNEEESALLAAERMSFYGLWPENYRGYHCHH